MPTTISGGNVEGSKCDVNNPLYVSYSDNGNIDAFGRLRVSNPETIFDSKNIFDDPNLAANVVNALKLGSLIDGTSDEIVLCVTPIGGSSNVDVEGSITWRELN